jgi:hypothetical protein
MADAAGPGMCSVTRSPCLESDRTMSAMGGFAGDRIALLADYLTLVYHEARNVRHLVSEGVVEPERWRFLVALPKNRDAAWREMQGLRRQASLAESASESAQVFTERFSLSLEDLE